MAVPILKQGAVLIASVQPALTDADLMQIQQDLAQKVGSDRAHGVAIDVTKTTKLRGAATVIVDWAVGGRPHAGEMESADHHVVAPFAGGVVGDRLPKLRLEALSVAPGDILVFATDGIASKFADLSPLSRDPQQIADEIPARCCKKCDDALVLVAQYGGATQ
jgi:hypothetical protein